MLVLVLDQISKYWIVDAFTLYESMPLFSGLNITYVQNTGAAFSFLSSAGGWQRWLFIALSSGVSIGLVVWIYTLPVTWRWLAASLAFILGGAVGNLTDRVLHGYVIDFIDVYYDKWHFPAFNIADSAISVGVVMLIIDTFWFDNVCMGRHGNSIKK